MSVSELKFKHPFTCIVAGITSSGKTCWTRKLLENHNYLIDMNKMDVKVLWCFGSEQEIYTISIENVHVFYSKGIPTIDLIQETKPDIIVIDDLMNELKKDEMVKNLFIKESHHSNISVIYITQNIFAQEKSMRTISLNAHYIIIMKGIRLTQQVSILGNQIYPGKSKKFLNIFKQATMKPFSYLLIDLHPKSNDLLRLRNRIFKEELPTALSRKYNSAPIYYKIE